MSKHIGKALAPVFSADDGPFPSDPPRGWRRQDDARRTMLPRNSRSASPLQ